MKSEKFVPPQLFLPLWQQAPKREKREERKIQTLTLYR
jgi:hypothetical protein